MSDVYTAEVSSQLPRLLGGLDREEDSRSFGSFDREHWGWKFRDHPITMLQYGLVPLAHVWRDGIAAGEGSSGYRGNPRLLGWIEGGIEATLRRQSPTGAFDSVGPNTFDHGVSLAMSFALSETAAALGESLTPALRTRVCEHVARALAFAEGSSEDYAFISNHHALFALAWHSAGALLGDARAGEQARRSVDAILAHQADEGWYAEYGGPDPGYESLGLFYLALLWERTGWRDLLESLGRSIGFVRYCVHPDGSLGGVYGSRSTQLYFPGGLEILARELPQAAAVADFLRARLAWRNVVTPTSVDAENLPTLLHSHLEAARAHEQRTQAGGSEGGELPCEALRGRVDFDGAGLHAVGADRYYAVLSTRKGGVMRLFDRATGQLAYEDAGYEARARGERWSSQRASGGERIASPGEGELACRTAFARVRQDLPSAPLFLALRVLQLVAFRWHRLGAWLRRRIVGRLVTAVEGAPLELSRSFQFGEEGIEVWDRIEGAGARQLERIELARAATPLHMGSARTFHFSQLRVTPLPPPGTLLQDLVRAGSGERRFRILFPREGGPGEVTVRELAARPAEDLA